MELYNTTTRRKEIIEDQESLHNALLSGSHSFPSGSSVHVFSPGGEHGVIPAEDVTDAINQGYRIETPIEGWAREQGFKGAVKVGLGQFADEALLGLGELIYNKTGDPYKVAQKEALKKENELTNTLFGLGGFGASLLTGGPLWKSASKAGKAASKYIADKLAVSAGETLGKRTLSKLSANLASKAAGGATEGAVIALPHAITETALGEPGEAAETMLSSVGVGSLLGVGVGLGKEFLGLGKKIIDESSRLVGESDLTKERIARRIAKVVTGVNENQVLEYMKDPERINNARSVPSIVYSIEDGVSKIRDEFEINRRAYSKLEENFNQSYKNSLRDLSQSRPPQSLADDIIKALDAEKITQYQLSQEALNHLDNVPGTMKRSSLLAFITKVKNNLAPFRIGRVDIAAAKNLDDLYQNVVTELPEKVPMRYVKETLKQIGRDTNFLYAPGEFNEQFDIAGKNLYRLMSNYLKKKSPEYAQAMDAMSSRLKVHSELKKYFTSNVRGAETLNSMLGPGNEVKRKLLEDFSQMVGGNYSDEFNKILRNKETLEKSVRGEITAADLLPEQYKQLEAAKKKLDESKNSYEQVKFLKPTRLENIIRGMSHNKENIANRRALTYLQQITGIPYLEQINDRNILDAFGKASTQGSRKVNAAALIANALLSESGVLGGVTGFGLGGPVGMAAGAAAGATLDIYGGQLLKSFMDRSPNVSGLLFVEKAIKHTADKLDSIPTMLENMAEGIKTKVKDYPSKHIIATDALYRLLSEEEPPKKSKKDIGQQLQKVQDKIGSIIFDPSKFETNIGKLTSSLRDGGAPLISEHLSLGARRALEYLYGKIPKPPAPSSPFAPKITWEPSDWEINKFSQILQIAENPLSVLDEFARGTLTMNHMDALRSMFPTVARAIQKQIYEYASSDKAKSLNYQDRLRLSLLAGVPLDSSLNHIGSMQKRFSEEDKPKDEGFTPKRKIDVADQQSTELQSALAK